MYEDAIDLKLKRVLKKFERIHFMHNGRSFTEGMDCLGFIILFYREFGIEIPDGDGNPINKDWYKHDPERYIRGIKAMGKEDVTINNLKPLDLVYFSISHNIVSHTGVMISHNRFAHISPKRGFQTRLLERRWKKMFRGGIRLIE